MRRCCRSERAVTEEPGASEHDGNAERVTEGYFPLTAPELESDRDPTGDDSIAKGVRSAGPLAIAGLVANGSQVIVTVLLAHFLVGRHEYGYWTSLVAIFLVVSNPGSAVIVAVVRRSTIWRVQGKEEELRRWARDLHRWGAVVLGVYAVVVALLAPAVARALLGVDRPLPVIFMLVGAGVWVMLSIDRGLLQSTRAYGDLSVNLLVEGGVRFVFVLGLVVLSPHVLSACVGIFIAEVASVAHARYFANRHLAAPGAALAVSTAEVVDDAAIVVDLVTAVLALAMLALLLYADVMFQHTSDGYAAISTATKSMYFVAIVLSGYLVPEAAIRWRQGRAALHALGVVLLILAVPAAALLGVSVVVPHLSLSLVFASKDLGASGSFATLAAAQCCLAITVVLTLYLLAIGKRWIVGLLAGGAGALVLAVHRSHSSAHHVAQVDLVVQAVLLGAVGACFMVTHLRAHRGGSVPEGTRGSLAG